MQIKFALLSCAALALVACGGNSTADKVEDTPAVEAPAKMTLADAIANPDRADQAARDEFRNPAETLAFFEVGPGKRVAEVWPGWYTPILAPYLADNDGAYVAVLYDAGDNEGLMKRNAGFKEKFGTKYSGIEYGAFGQNSGAMLPAESVDVVLTFRNVHNWMRSDYTEKAFADFHAALKPGGILGVVEHRLPETREQDPMGSSGYVQESYMKDMAKRAGFEFVEASEINANPLDTADHPMGVWTLPPRSAMPKEGSADAADFNAAAYKNIGESDRATLKFRKPK